MTTLPTVSKRFCEITDSLTTDSYDMRYKVVENILFYANCSEAGAFYRIQFAKRVEDQLNNADDSLRIRFECAMNDYHTFFEYQDELIKGSVFQNAEDFIDTVKKILSCEIDEYDAPYWKLA